ncbi:hypothetical protein AAL_07714 [Moelleriella libera RCEF 2490]|uniref:Uncharacterized protein n=1 Tax=Moelleriella libera RCEF 2490 TaxID=1081109 RepID=A0A167WY85_9HYPO|nr:hypothetical protein AAL_07714 [Moelleriella libera RCEF 2490]
MVNAVLWTALSLAAAGVQGAMIPRAQKAPGSLSLADLVRDSYEVRGHMKQITDKIDPKVLPFAEARLKNLKQVNTLQEVLKEVQLDKQEEKKRDCFFLRNMMNPQGVKVSMDITAYADRPDHVNGGDQDESWEITQSVAKIDTERIGWSTDQSSEVGGSVSAGGSAGIGPFQASLEATVYGNTRAATGKNGEASNSGESKQDTKWTKPCPKKSTCRVVTWTYTRKISGTCLLVPIGDKTCLTPNEKGGNFSLATDFTYKDLSSAFFVQAVKQAKSGPQWQDLKMHDVSSIDSKFTSPCSFSYVLRLENGEPVRAQALISEPLPRDVPKAVGWRGEGAKKACKLATKGWWWQPGGWFLVPESDKGSGDWEQHDDWLEPAGRESKCPDDNNNKARRAPASAANDDAPPKENLKQPAKNKLVKVDIGFNEVPKLVKQLQETKNKGFVEAPKKA